MNVVVPIASCLAKHASIRHKGGPVICERTKGHAGPHEGESDRGILNWTSVVAMETPRDAVVARPRAQSDFRAALGALPVTRGNAYLTDAQWSDALDAYERGVTPRVLFAELSKTVVPFHATKKAFDVALFGHLKKRRAARRS